MPLVLALSLAGCGGGPKPDTGPSIPDYLQIRWPGADEAGSVREFCAPTDTLTIPGGSFVCAVTDSVLPSRAPIPHNSAERLVFAHLYETLVTVDCQGTPHPGLAVRWTCTQDSTVWVFSIRDDARFWDGTPITAGDVRNAWTSNQGCPRTDNQTSPWSWFNARARSVSVLDAKRLAIRLPEPQAGFPLLLAHPATAVSIDRPGWTWPVGSGPCRLRASTPAPLPDLVCRPNVHHPAQPIWKELKFLVRPGLDKRDLVAGESDLLLVRKLQDVAFYHAAPGFRTESLPWDRLYVLLCPPDTNPQGSGRWLEAAERLSLPDDITSVATATWPGVVFPGGGPTACPQLTGPVTTSGAAPLDWQLADQQLDENVLIFADADSGARELAERLAALTGPDIRVAPLAAPSYAFALQWQMSGGCVLALDQDFPCSCLQLASLLGRSAWLQKAALARPVPDTTDNLVAANRWSEHDSSQSLSAVANRLVESGLAIPLALTRPYLVLRGDLAGVRLDYDGTPLLSGLGRSRSGGPVP